jgi:hypothetical protein
MSAYEAGRQIGYVAAPFILLAIAAYVGRRMGRKKQPPKFVAWPLALTAILIAFGMIGTLAMKLR